MAKKVCMFVWNHFTNDARVLRECTALSNAGYSVDLICIQDPENVSLPRVEKGSFTVYRLRRYPIVIDLARALARSAWYVKLAALVLAALFLYVFPFYTAGLFLLGIILLKTKVNVLWVRGSLVLRMIIAGVQKKYEIYHSNDLNTLPQGYICAKWRFRPKKLVYDSHEVQTSRTGYSHPIYGKLEGFLIKKIDRMIVENHTRAKYNEELYGFYPNVVHNYPFRYSSSGNEKVNLHNFIGIPMNEKILLYQGGIQTGRGLDKLIRAVPLMEEGVLVLIGDGKIKKQLQDLTTELKLEARVKFLPKVPLSELPKYTNNAFLGFQVLNNVCFNHYSASSNKLFEYMMSGVPVVACSFPEIQKVVEGEQTGICIDSHDPVSIANGVNYLLRNPEKVKEMKKSSIIASKKYNWEKEQVQFLQVYQYLNF